MLRKTLLAAAAVVLGSHIAFGGALEQTVNSYKQNANETIRAASAGQITQQNADQYIQRQEQLVKLSQDVIANIRAQQQPEAQKVLDLVSKNIDAMKSQDAATIRAQWEQGEAFKKAGIDANAINASSPSAAAAKNSAIQSAATLASLREFKQSGNKQALDSARTQLESAVAQITKVSASAGSAAGASNSGASNASGAANSSANSGAASQSAPNAGAASEAQSGAAARSSAPNAAH